MTLFTGFDSSTADINCPVDCSPGDLISVAVLNNHGSDTTLPTAPAGFETAGAVWRGTGSTLSTAIFYKIADGTETTSTVFTVGDFTAGTRKLVCTVRSVESGRTWTFISATAGSETGTAHVMGGIGSSVGPVFYVASLAAGANGNSSYAGSAFTELHDFSGVGSTAYWDDPTPGTIGTTCTTGNSVDAGWILAGFEAILDSRASKTGLIVGGRSIAASLRDGVSRVGAIFGGRSAVSRTERTNKTGLPPIGGKSTLSTVRNAVARGGFLIGSRSVTSAPPWAVAKVEIAFTVPHDVDPDPGDWVDVTADYRAHGGEIITTRGARQSTEQADAGTASLSLSDPDGAYEPDYLAGVNAPDVRPMRHIRITAEYWGVVYGVWRGYVRSFTPRWPTAGNDILVDLACIDILRRLAMADVTLLSTDEIAADSPLGYWLLDDTVGAAVDTGTGANDGAYGAGVVLADVELTAGSDRLAPRFDPATFQTTATGVNVGNIAGLIITGDLTLIATIKGNSFDTDPAHSTWGHNIVECADRSAVHDLTYSLGVRASGVLQYRHEGVNLVLSDVGSDPDLSDGQAHKVAITRTIDAGVGTIRGWIDGEETSLSGLTYDHVTLPPSSLATNEIGLLERVHNGSSGMGFDGWAEGVAILDVALPAGRIVAIQQTALNTLPSERTDLRIGRIADVTGIPAALRSFETGATVLQSTEAGGKALRIAQEAAKAEMGQLLVDCDGRLVFHSRWHRGETPRAAVFGDLPSELPAVNASPGTTEATIRNDVTASRTGGIEQRSVDSQSVAEFGARNLGIGSLEVGTDVEAGSFADAIVGRFSHPELTIVELVVDPAMSPGELWPLILGLDVGDRIGYCKTLPRGGGRIDLEMFVEGVSHRISHRKWVTTLTLSPGSHAFWVLGVSRLGQDTHLGY